MIDLENPVLGIRATVRRSTPELWQAEVWVAPGGNGGPPHIHLRQHERFRILDGAISYRVGPHRGVAASGDIVLVPARTVHSFRNESQQDAHLYAEFTPALRIEEFFANLFGLAQDGRTSSRGLPGPLQAAALIHEFPDEFFYPPHIPVSVMRAVAAPLASVARRRGLRGAYPGYAVSPPSTA